MRLRSVALIPMLTLLAVTAHCQASHSAALTWTASATSGATYQVLRSASATGSFTQIATGVTGLTYTDSGLSASTQYCYEVIAQSTGNSDSAPSNVVCGSTLQNQTAPPGALTVIFK